MTRIFPAQKKFCLSQPMFQTNLKRTKIDPIGKVLTSACVACVGSFTSAGLTYAQDFVPILDIADAVDIIDISNLSFEPRADDSVAIDALEQQKSKIQKTLGLYQDLKTSDLTGLSLPEGLTDVSPPETYSDALSQTQIAPESMQTELFTARLILNQSPEVQDTILRDAQQQLETIEADILRAKAAAPAQTRFWDQRKALLSGNIGVAINPNKLEAEQGEKDGIFRSITKLELTKFLPDSDNDPLSLSILNLVGVIDQTDYFEDLGPDTEVAVVGAAYTRVFDDCWSVTATPSIALVTSNFFSDHDSWMLPLTAIVKRESYADKSCKLGRKDRDAVSETSLKYTRTLSDPSARNRHEISVSYKRNFPVSDKVTLILTPEIKYTSFSNLPGDAKLDITDATLKASLSRALSKGVAIEVTGEFGRRSSSDPLRDSDFANVPLTLKISRQF